MLPEYRDLITELKGKDAHFDRLFEKHNKLDHEIKDAEEGRSYLSDSELSVLKKEKLLSKDELHYYLKNYQSNNS